MLRIGLTGGIASGKSTVSRHLASLGAVIVDADQLAREVVAPGTPALAEIVDSFGPGILLPDGSLDRPALGRLVFADSGQREKLNAIVHPRVRERAAELSAQAPQDGVLVEDIPLLVETGQAGRFDLVLVVDAPESAQVRRLISERGLSEEEARARIGAQASREQRRAQADVVILNDAGVQELTAQLDRLWVNEITPRLHE